MDTSAWLWLLNKNSYYVYEVTSQSYFILTPTIDGKNTQTLIQKVKWAPQESSSSSHSNSNKKSSGNASNSIKNSRQGIAFVYNYDVYYKPKVQGEIVNRITKNGKSIFVKNFLSIKCIAVNIPLSNYFSLKVFLKNITELY